jgi:hypothetical protein
VVFPLHPITRYHPPPLACHGQDHKGEGSGGASLWPPQPCRLLLEMGDQVAVFIEDEGWAGLASSVCLRINDFYFGLFPKNVHFDRKLACIIPITLFGRGQAAIFGFNIIDPQVSFPLTSAVDL